MFYQVTGTLFRLVYHFREHVKSAGDWRPVPRVGKLPAREPAPVPVDEQRLLGRFRSLVEERIQGKDTFLGPLGDEVLRLADLPLGEFNFPLSLWVEALYRAIIAFRDGGEEVLGALEPLWQGRYLSFVLETKGLSTAEAEGKIRDQLAEFRRLRHLVVEAL